jgi:hypothetical protein
MQVEDLGGPGQRALLVEVDVQRPDEALGATSVALAGPG